MYFIRSKKKKKDPSTHAKIARDLKACRGKDGKIWSNIIQSIFFPLVILQGIDIVENKDMFYIKIDGKIGAFFLYSKCFDFKRSTDHVTAFSLVNYHVK